MSGLNPMTANAAEWTSQRNKFSYLAAAMLPTCDCYGSLSNDGCRGLSGWSADVDLRRPCLTIRQRLVVACASRWGADMTHDMIKGG
jgi:hypothetical protein